MPDLLHIWSLHSIALPLAVAKAATQRWVVQKLAGGRAGSHGGEVFTASPHPSPVAAPRLSLEVLVTVVVIAVVAVLVTVVVRVTRLVLVPSPAAATIPAAMPAPASRATAATRNALLLDMPGR